MKALEKERNRRYETANSLARDIERHLQDQPVEAGPPSVRYRVGKFARRNQIALATTALVLAALCLGGGLSAAMSFEARTARLLAEQRRRVHLESYVQIMWGGKIIHEVAQRRLQLDESTKDVLNRFASLANQAPLSSNEQLASVRAELLRGVLDFWDQAIRLDTGKDGEAIGRAYFYRIQRLLCLARAGEHRQAAQEAEAVWRQMQLPPGKPSISLASDPKDSVNIQSSGAPFNRAANDLKTFVSTGYGGVPASESSGDLEYDFARVYALCAVAVKSEPLLARQYSDRAMDFLRFASEADFFKAPSRSVRLASDGDLGTLREREDFLELLAGVQARLR